MSHETFAIHFLRILVESFIGYPDKLKMRAVNEANFARIIPIPDSRDFGRIVGSGGAMYANLTLLMRLAGKKHGKTFLLERMAKPTNGEREFPTPKRAKEDWSTQDTQKVEAILRQILDGILEHYYTITTRGDDVRTTFIVKIEDSEPLPIQQEEVLNAVSRVLGAIGNVRGRDISVSPA